MLKTGPLIQSGLLPEQSSKHFEVLVFWVSYFASRFTREFILSGVEGLHVFLFGMIKWSGTGNCEHKSKTSLPTSSITDSFSILSTTLFMKLAICLACSSFIPRVVIAGVPMRSPLGFIGGAGSLGMVL